MTVEDTLLFDHSKPTTYPDERRAACQRISALMAQRRPFSFLRLGDMELMFLIACQQNQPVYWQRSVENEASTISSVQAFGHPGLLAEHGPRLQTAYESCTYLDYHDGWKTNKAELPKWQHNRDPSLFRNPGPHVSQLFFDWLYHEFSRYVRGRRCLFAGAEAGLLEELYRDPIYLKAANNYWPNDAKPFFFPEVRRVGKNLEAIKVDLSSFVEKHNIDTAFISLGGASKILCHELAIEHSIAAFDFGSLMRGLTYSGSDGHNFFRTTHYPFYFRVPFDIYMRALLRTMPDLAPEEVLAKAHAQLALELIRKEIGWSYGSEWVGEDCLDLGDENRRAFWQAYEIYQQEYLPLQTANEQARSQAIEFDRWRKHLGLGLDGKIHRIVFKSKVTVRNLLTSGAKLAAKGKNKVGSSK